jgi:molybdopterin/thiamine biosynthesis adenylyltransferase
VNPSNPLEPSRSLPSRNSLGVKKVKDIERYSRQLILPEVGGEGQKRLKSARVLLVGAGGLGSPAALYLAAAGVGTLVLVDNDDVDLTNLHRQILHFTPDVGTPKVHSARDKILALNPRLRVRVKKTRLTLANAPGLFVGSDLVLDGSDNFETRYAVNTACVSEGIPLVWGAVLRWEGQVMTVFPGQTACYECLFPEPPDPALAQTCSNAGIMGSVVGTIGSLMATEGLKVLLGLKKTGTGRLWTMDLLNMKFRERMVPVRSDCRVCGGKPAKKIRVSAGA